MSKRVESDDEEDEATDVYFVDSEVFFYCDVSTETVQKLHKILLCIYKKYKSRKDAEIILHLMTEGGCVFAGFAMHDILRDLCNKISIVVIVEGICASAGSLILLGTDKRYIRKHGMVLIHDISTSFGGKYEDFKAEMKTLDKLTRNLVNLYHSRTTMKKEYVAKLLKGEKWIGSRKCAKLGLANVIVYPV
jgi:ATP-dependent protease ClpP protease subunit